MSSSTPPDETSAPVAPGDVLDGKFRVERVLAAGGIGVVVAAEHLTLNQRVALKFLLPEAARSPETVQRFRREAATAARLKSAHVARIFDTGVLADGSPYIVMEYLEGRDLAALVAAVGPLPVLDAVTYVLQALEAVAEAHAAGIIHRDLKPHNLFLTEVTGRATVKVLDFGIAKIGEAVTQLTQTGTFLGTPQYMAPEQLRDSGTVDARADVYALGVILFQLLSARRPFEGETLPELVTKILFETPPPLDGPDLPLELAAVVERCLAKAPGDRYADAGALATALEPFGGPDAAVLAERVRRASLPSALPTSASSPDFASVPTVLGTTGGGAVPVRVTGSGGSSSGALPARSVQGTAVDVASVATRAEVPAARPGRSKATIVLVTALVALGAGAAAGVALVRAARPASHLATAEHAGVTQGLTAASSPRDLKAGRAAGRNDGAGAADVAAQALAATTDGGSPSDVVGAAGDLDAGLSLADVPDAEADEEEDDDEDESAEADVADPDAGDGARVAAAGRPRAAPKSHAPKKPRPHGAPAKKKKKRPAGAAPPRRGWHPHG